jgi:hypothetical protein
VSDVTRLFLPQATLEEWALEDKADLEDGRLVVANEPGSYPVTPAVHFLRLVTGADENDLIGRVKTEEQLATLGAEHMADSVVLGETAFEVVPGYLTEVASPAVRPADKRPSSPEADMLAAFILNKLP